MAQWLNPRHNPRTTFPLPPSQFTMPKGTDLHLTDGLFHLARAATGMGNAELVCPGVWVIPTNVPVSWEGGFLSFQLACYNHIPPLTNPYPFGPSWDLGRFLPTWDLTYSTSNLAVNSLYQGETICLLAAWYWAAISTNSKCRKAASKPSL